VCVCVYAVLDVITISRRYVLLAGAWVFLVVPMHGRDTDCQLLFCYMFTRGFCRGVWDGHQLFVGLLNSHA